MSNLQNKPSNLNIIPGCTVTRTQKGMTVKVKILWPSSCVEGFYCEVIESNCIHKKVGSRAHYKNEILERIYE